MSGFMYRTEKDLLGSVKVPSDAYYGSETQRSLDSFKVSGIRNPIELVHAYAMLKKAAALANMKDGKLDGKKAKAIAMACDYVIAGKLDGQFNIDVFQAGAGTSLNMNVNEVIANKAIELLGGRKGNYRLVHPNDHVNMSQSTNDTMPCVVHIATYMAIKKRLVPSLKMLEGELDRKAKEFKGTIKMGRTHLQDAVPMTLGQEFSGYKGALGNAIGMIDDAKDRMLHIPLGGTAVGTQINADRRYERVAVKEINRMTKSHFVLSKNKFPMMQQRIEELAVADALKEGATAINKIANDLRILASGPAGGMGEIILPEILPGSSIMPGKVNPSMAEMMNMVCLNVMGSCTTVTEAANGGQLEINVFTPIIAHNLLFSINTLSNASRLFAQRCIAGIKVNRGGISKHLEMDISLATALSPYIGYAKASKIASIARREHKSVKQVCIELNVMGKKELDRILDPKNQV